VTATLMGELLVATIIVLMLTGGQTLEEFATQRASSVLIALARRMPSIAHRIAGDTTNDLPVSDIRIGTISLSFPMKSVRLIEPSKKVQEPWMNHS
jgi:cation transport ATPase